MKTYSDLQATDLDLKILLELEPIGVPEVSVLIKENYCDLSLYKSVKFELAIDLLEPFKIEIELKNKVYESKKETAVLIKKIVVDNIDLVPGFEYLAQYQNDHNNTSPTNYLGFNGKWTLTFDRPFYQWLHQATGQGWLLG